MIYYLNFRRNDWKSTLGVAIKDLARFHSQLCFYRQGPENELVPSWNKVRVRDINAIQNEIIMDCIGEQVVLISLPPINTAASLTITINAAEAYARFSFQERGFETKIAELEVIRSKP